jgi:hypothetical protein
MRLIDRVVNSPPQFETTDAAGGLHRMAGVGAKSSAIKECALRYILDPNASDECMRLLTTDNNGLLDPASPLLRFPAETFWLEWFGTTAGHPKWGVLVETGPDGRRGCLTVFFQDEFGRADTVGAFIEFDLDGLAGSAFGSNFSIQHDTYLHLNRLLACATGRLDPGWDRYFRTRPAEEYRRNLADVAQYCWHLLPMTCAFAAMLNSVDILTEAPSNLERLNAARVRRGREPLLDHIEVSIRFGQARDGLVRSGQLRTKSSPRLHHVRGHFVHRAGKTFWRSPHLRGDVEKPIVQKTVVVHGGRLGSAPGGRRYAV